MRSVIVVDLFRVEGGKVVEHWEALQNEVAVTATLGGTAMFDPDEGARCGRPPARRGHTI